MSSWMIFEKGGMVMMLLALLSVYALGVVLFKIWQFRKLNVFDRSFVEPSLRDIKEGERDRAMQTLANKRGPLARIMRVTFESVLNRDMSQKSREAEIMRVGAADIREMEAHLRGLEMTAGIAPLMGLFGTVLGLIDSFAKLGSAGTRVDPTVLAGGIWEALLTTAGGLAVAIPALAAHYVIDGVIEKMRASMKDVSVQILALEDEFRRNERLRAMEEARRLDEERKKREEKAEAERWALQQQLEVQRIAEEEHKARLEKELKEAEERRKMPQEAQTLRQLKPNYSQIA